VLVALVALALAGPPSAQLTITVWPAGRAHASRAWTLRCAPVGGTLPRRAAACTRLARVGANVFAPVPPATVCSQIYGGPQVGVVRGLFRGRRVWATFTRRNGCEISRWNRVAFLFPVRL
jgi:Subtilisin inhibitor-like